MKKKRIIRFCIALCFILLFTVWTLLVCVIDVQPIGPLGSSVGFASLNGAVHRFIGVNTVLYTVTDWLGLVPIATALCFAVIGAAQLFRRKSLLRVDRSLLALGAFYIAVIALFLLFEAAEINYRPVLIEGRLEASYPSSTTLFVMCVMPTALMQASERIRRTALRRSVIALTVAFICFTVVGRILSGVHWITDIIGGAILSAGTVTAYFAFEVSE